MSSRNDALKNDALIQDIVIYELTRGNTKTLQEKDLDVLQDRFSEYKSLIIRGEFTYDELADKVFNEYGITEPLVTPRMQLPPPTGRSMDERDTEDFLANIRNILDSETIQEVKEPEKPYRWYQKIYDKIYWYLASITISM